MPQGAGDYNRNECRRWQGAGLNQKRPVRYLLRLGRRIGIAVVGGAVVFVGLLMIVLPGPAFIVIPVGLGILSLEFEAPRRWMLWLRQRAEAVKARAFRRGSATRSTAGPGHSPKARRKT